MFKLKLNKKKCLKNQNIINSTKRNFSSSLTIRTGRYSKTRRLSLNKPDRKTAL